MHHSPSYILIITFIVSIVGCTTRVSSINDDYSHVLQEGNGYLFITVDSNLYFSRFTVNGAKKIQLNNPDKFKGKTYYLVEVPAGQYQIDQIGVAYYSRFDFDEDEDVTLWGFKVSPGVISYVGDLRARHVFGLYSKFELLNNSSQALEYMQEKHKKILNNTRLEYRGPGKDFFFDLVLKKAKGEAVL